MKFGSLFAGIGGFDLGLERAGMTPAWQVEIDDYATKILEKHWPTVTRFRDVRTVGSHNLEPVDLICGGFPCQDISLAGKGEGIEGKRSGLWKEFYRIIREIRPRYVLVENVSALRSRGLPVVLSDLASVGYDAEWHCLPASAFGAPHRRDRIWIVAYATGSRLPCGESESGRKVRDETWRTEPERRGDALVDTDGSGLKRSGSAQSAGRIGYPVIARTRAYVPDANSKSSIGTSKSWRQCGHWAIEPDVGRVADGIPKRVDRLKCLGNAVVPQVVEWIGRTIMRNASAKKGTPSKRLRL